jgi:ABC-type glycerol-3-phosphate transport system substrate-binding protein
MRKMKHFSKVMAILLLIVMTVLIVACAAQPTPETVIETVVVEKEKEVKVIETVEVEKEVVKEVEVEKEVIKETRPIIYNSYQSDPDPRAVDEKLVQMFNEQNPETPIQHSTVNHEDFKQAIRAYLVADPAPDVLTKG